MYIIFFYLKCKGFPIKSSCFARFEETVLCLGFQRDGPFYQTHQCIFRTGECIDIEFGSVNYDTHTFCLHNKRFVSIVCYIEVSFTSYIYDTLILIHL
mgnify:CR=1 FL=1